MANEDGSVWVTFNGEIYNHLELRGDLEHAGHRFRTQSDTEVLVHGWEEWGERLFEKLNGIFALAIVEAPSSKVILARDPIGVKPLYLGQSAGRTWWVSELQAAESTGLIGRSVSRDALKLFCTFRFTPSPSTLFENVWKVPPGHIVELKPSSAKRTPIFKPYQCEIRSSAEPKTRRDWQEAVFAELEQAVSRQLMADVPVASLLSGGVDSTLITQMMAARLPDPPHSFGIGFPSDGSANEALSAEVAARALGTTHSTTLVEDAEFIASWPRALQQLGEPIADTSLLPIGLICAEVGKTHKVVLSGQGADEPLGGYPRHLIERIYPVGRIAPGLVKLLASRTVGPEEARRLGRAMRARDRVGRYVEALSMIPVPLVDSLIPGPGPSASELARAAVERWTVPESPKDTLNEFLRIDARLSLADDLLIVADHFAMQSSVELRVPFLDLELLELLERMPSRYKVSATGKRKHLYRSGIHKHLPARLAASLAGPDRLTKKRGFSLPPSIFSPGPEPAAAASFPPALSRLPIEPQVFNRLSNEPKLRQRALLLTLAAWAAGHPQPPGERLEAPPYRGGGGAQKSQEKGPVH